MPDEHRCKYCRGKIVTLHIGQHIYVYCERCGDRSSPYDIPKEAIRQIFKKSEPAPVVIDIKPTPAWKTKTQEIYIKGRELFKIWGKSLYKKYKQTREKTMTKVEVVKSRSWFLINVLGQKICKDNPELFEHFKDNKPIKLTVETLEKEEPKVEEKEPETTVEDFVPKDDEVSPELEKELSEDLEDSDGEDELSDEESEEAEEKKD